MNTNPIKFAFKVPHRRVALWTALGSSALFLACGMGGPGGFGSMTRSCTDRKLPRPRFTGPGLQAGAVGQQYQRELP